MRSRIAAVLLLAACPSPMSSSDSGFDAGGGTDAGLLACPATSGGSTRSCDVALQCNYGQESCCGQTFPSIVCTCQPGQQLACHSTDACLIPACPDAGTDAGTSDGGSTDAGVADAGPCLIDRVTHSGDGTAYTPGNVNMSVCNVGLPIATLLRAAIAMPDYDGGLCGACARVRGDAGTAIVLLDDVCPSCAAGDLDFTDEALVAVAGSNNGRYPITWELVPCPVTGNIDVDLQGSNAFYVKLRLSKHRAPLAGVAVRSADAGAYTTLSRTPDNFWVLSGSGPYGFPLAVRATDVFGQQIDLVVPVLVSSQVMDAGGQFPAACAP